MADSKSPIEQLLSALDSDSEVQTLRVEGNNLEEVLQNLRQQAPEGIPPEVLSAMENIIRKKFGERDSASHSGKSKVPVIDHWTEQERDMFVSTLSALFNNLGRYDPDLDSPEIVNKGIAHLVFCPQWDPEKVRPLIIWMLENPARIPSMINVMNTFVHGLACKFPIPSVEDLKLKDELAEDRALDITHPAMLHLAETIMDHVDNAFHEGNMIASLLSYAVPDAYVLNGTCKDHEEADARFDNERMTTVVNQLLKDETLSPHAANTALYSTTVALPAKMYLIARALGNDSTVERMTGRLPDTVVKVLDAAALLCFGVKAIKGKSDTVLH